MYMFELFDSRGNAGAWSTGRAQRCQLTGREWDPLGPRLRAHSIFRTKLKLDMLLELLALHLSG